MRYRIMRGLCKTKFARDVFWFILRLFKRKELRVFLNDIRSQKSEVFSECDIQEIVDGINKNGAVAGPFLKSEFVNQIYQSVIETQCYADRDRIETKGFYFSDYKKICASLGKEVLVAQYFNTLSNDLIKKIAYDPLLLRIAANYLKATPIMVGSNVWWSFPANASAEDKSKHAHVFHFDLDDIKFVKFFFYLTDVSIDDGPHVYVEGSNRTIKYKNSLIRSKRFTDEEIVSAYGEDAIKVVTGKAGDCLIEDTITLHKGVTPTKKPRLLMQFEYAINDFGEMSDGRD